MSRERKKRDTSKKRKSIIDAAERVFLEAGYEKASMDRIAEVAGASKRTVYNHFPSKEALLREVISQFSEQMSRLKKIPYDKKTRLEDQLGKFIEAELSVARNPLQMGMIRFLISVFSAYPEVAKEAMSKHLAGKDGLSLWMRAASDDGKLATDDYRLAARVFSAMISGAITWPAVYQGILAEDISPQLKEELIKTFMSRYSKQG